MTVWVLLTLILIPEFLWFLSPGLALATWDFFFTLLVLIFLLIFPLCCGFFLFLDWFSFAHQAGTVLLPLLIPCFSSGLMLVYHYAYHVYMYIHIIYVIYIYPFVLVYQFGLGQEERFSAYERKKSTTLQAWGWELISQCHTHAQNIVLVTLFFGTSRAITNSIFRA